MSTSVEILRAQWDQRAEAWKIVKKTTNGSGGWKRYGGEWYGCKEDAERVVSRLVNQFPEHYQEG